MDACRPKSRWRDQVVEDINKIKIKNWKTVADKERGGGKLSKKPRFIMDCRVTKEEKE